MTKASELQKPAIQNPDMWSYFYKTDLHHFLLHVIFINLRMFFLMTA